MIDLQQWLNRQGAGRHRRRARRQWLRRRIWPRDRNETVPGQPDPAAGRRAIVPLHRGGAMRQLLTTISAGALVGAAIVAAIAVLWHTGHQSAALIVSCAATGACIAISITAARGPRRAVTSPSAQRFAPVAAAFAVAAATALTAALLGQPAQPAAVTTGTQPSDVGAYLHDLDAITGWNPQDPDDALATGRTICQMLATGWNEAGVVANMLTWQGNQLTQNQLAAAVHLTHLRLCGQGT